ncbi:MAG: right-handed parallel beta-helix repeat-containing protein [Candidatus Hodarchaeota archaeon]
MKVENMKHAKFLLLVFAILLFFGMNWWVIPIEPQPTIEGEFVNRMTARPRLPIQKVSSIQVYNERGPISVNGDSDLMTQFPGHAGTSTDPIRIENYNITYSGGTLISIGNTTYYFSINNCLLNGLGTTINGIYFDDVIHGTIVNNTIYDNFESGILVSGTGSENNTIESNTIYNNGHGIHIDEADNNTIFNNSVHENAWSGIRLSNSSHNFISENYVHNHSYSGIALFSCSENTISHNTAYNNDLNGIKIADADSTNNKLFFNTIYNSGGSGILIYTIPINLDIFNTILNNTCFNNSYKMGSGIPDYWTSGITVDYSSANISNNTVFDNFDNGMLILRSKNSVVSNNIIRDNARHGISVALANTTTIANNEVFNNAKDGIHFFGSFNNSILNNSIYNNMMTGISLSLFDDLGIYRSGSDSNNISNNAIFNTYGVNIFAGTNNLITHNDITGESTDSGTNNVFTENYWSDWAGSGVYNIGGSPGNQDPYPATNPYHLSAPIITAPATDLTLEDEVVIQWTASTDTLGHLLTYSVFYSPNNGVSWTSLVSNLLTTSYTLDTTTIADGTYILLKVQVTDSVGFIAETISEQTFLILNALSPPTIIFPNGRETLNGTVTIEWKTSLDPFDHSVTYTVYYSSDNGAFWTVLATDLTTTSYSWDTTTVPNGFSYLIKVEATCSAGVTIESISEDTFAIQNPTSSVGTPGMSILMPFLAFGALVVLRRGRRG